ncbi:hypothetical protein RB24_16565 [Herbaspirillum rubrisubalbicans]|uniref:Uncharacterized protein n=1 Tax=Herbaspirillum rubrisubalbicans TaxID=80842 RepID=A0ABX9BZJ5_9BURK|nr:hypothetical protein RB24_16565 [Herbaspirillum rubrisubalbicans]
MRLVRRQVGFLPDTGPVHFAVIFVGGDQRRLLGCEQELAVGLQLKGESHDDDVEALFLLVERVERHRRIRREIAKFHDRCPTS